MSKILPFNKPYMTGKELDYIAEAHANNMLAGDGPFTKQCHAWLEKKTGASKVLLTHSCTASLEMAAMLIDTKPGDEIIMPSYTFVSTANAFVLRGGVPVFIDIRPDTLNIDESKIEAAITHRTKAIVPVHYAGVPCEMDSIMDIARRNKLFVIEDAAQGLMSTYKGRLLGSIGDIGCFSFHETKNIISGEGGAILINNKNFAQRAEVIREKGTNRSQFFRGQVDKYTWCDIGSSYLPGELIAAFLYSQLEAADEITVNRLSMWEKYHNSFELFETSGILRRPVIPEFCNHNGHMYYLLLQDLERRTTFIDKLKKNGVASVFHYIPLHSSPAGLKHGRTHGDLTITDDVADRLVRLPLWVGLEKNIEEVISLVLKSCK